MTTTAASHILPMAMNSRGLVNVRSRGQWAPVMVALAMTVFLGSCGRGTPTSAADSPSPTATGTVETSPTLGPTPSYSPTDLKAAQLTAMATLKADGDTCASGACPFTVELTIRLANPPIQGANPICRCQAPWSSATYDAEAGSNGIVVHVVLVATGPTPSSSSQARFDLTMVSQSEQWLVSDISCTGVPNSSIFDPNPPLC